MTRDWYTGISENVIRYLETIKKEGHGRYLPCRRGVTEVGREIELGWSCFALKIFWMLGEWQNMSVRNQRAWLDHIQSYQRLSDTVNPDGIDSFAYVDDAVVSYWADVRRLKKLTYSGILELLKSSTKVALGRKKKETNSQENRTIIADTKQALATLAQVGESSRKPYGYFPHNIEDLQSYVFSFDWRYPWDAGGQTSSLAVFLSLEAPRLLDKIIIQSLKTALCACYRELAVTDTGGYYMGQAPNHGMLVNGAMKVLTALDWLSEPIHYPRQLIDTTLSGKAPSDGCHLVDTVYVLYRCLRESEHRRKDIKKYLMEVLELIRRHYNQDGGFSYEVGSAQQWYYGVPISRGLNESDIHGTVLLTWALTMIAEIFSWEENNWEVIRP